MTLTRRNFLIAPTALKRIIASTSPYATTYARLAPSLVNTPEQVEAAVRAVREISG